MSQATIGAIILIVLSVLAGETAHALSTPSWWSGICNKDNYAASYALGSSYNGVISCGPGSTQGGDFAHTVNFGVGATQYQWECVELAMRYMYLAYGIAPYALSDNARTIVSDYAGSRLEKKGNNGSTLPIPGDVLALDITSYGHTAIVTDVGVDSSGNGTIRAIEQNSSPNGIRNINVVNNILQSNVTGWLHDPQSNPFTTFQSNINTLYARSGSLSSNTLQGMSSGTSPSTARTADGDYVTAFRANTGVLHVYNHTTKSSTITTQGIAANTSPAITGFSATGWQVVFHGADGYLHGYDSSGNDVNYLQGMKSGTSPAIVALKSGGWRAVFQANTGYLYVYSVTTGGSASTNLLQGMSSNTSPAITALSGSTWVASFRANTGVAYVYSSAVGSGQSLSINMASGTNPAITGLSPSVYTVVMQHTSGNLWRYQTGATTVDSGQGMKSGTSPTLRRTAKDVYYAAFQANTGYLHGYTEAGGGSSTGLGMDATTSPNITLLFPVE